MIRKIATILLLCAPCLMAQVKIGTGVQIGSATGLSNPLDVSRIAQSGEAVSTYQEQLFVASNSTVNLADIKGVSGTIIGFGIGLCPGTTSCSGAGNSGSSTLNFYYDGNTGTPDMAFVLGFAGQGWQLSNTSFQSQRITTQIANNTNGQGGYQFYYPMYFSTEWRLSITAPSSLTNGETAWITVWYTTTTTSSLRLKVSTAGGQTVNLSTSPFTVLTVASGSGIIAGAVWTIESAPDFTYSEANVQTYLDGSTAIGQAIPASGSSGTGCSVGDVLGVTQSGGSGGEVMVVAVSSGAVTALTPVLGNQGTGYSTASGLATTAISTTCSVRPTIYISTAANSNDSLETYLNNSLEFGVTGTRQANTSFVSAYGSPGNTHGYTAFFDILDQQKANRFTNGAVIQWQADPIKQTKITNSSITFDYAVWYYQ